MHAALYGYTASYVHFASSSLAEVNVLVSNLAARLDNVYRSIR